MDKNAVELVQTQRSLGFFNWLFLVPNPNNNWRPILDLSNLNQFLKAQKSKMETSETIRTSLQQREWGTSINFKDGYFHIPIQEQSRKYLRFHVQGQSYQFKALPFGLSTAPMEFTVIAKEVKLMPIHKGIRLHQYLDDWLVRAKICLQHTQDFVKMCQQLGWLVNLEKSKLDPKQVFDFVDYQFDLKSGQVRPTLDQWQNLHQKILRLRSLPACPVRQFMSLIGLLTATEKQVHLRLTAYETHTVASQKQLEDIRVSRTIDRYNNSQITAPPPTMVAGGKQRSSRSTITPNKTCSADLYRRIKRRVGRSLERAYCKRNLVPSRKQAAYKLPRTQSSLSGLKRFSGPLFRQDSSCSNQ